MRKAIQIEIAASEQIESFAALCDDGSMWYGVWVGAINTVQTVRWERLPDIPQDVAQSAEPPPVTNGRTSTADRVQQHMQANGQTGPLNPEPPAATAAEFKRIAIERGFTDRVKLDTIQAWVEALAPDYEGRPYKQLHGRDWAFLIAQMPASATPYSSGAEDPFEDTAEEIAAQQAATASA